MGQLVTSNLVLVSLLTTVHVMISDFPKLVLLHYVHCTNSGSSRQTEKCKLEQF
jgi:hypothetical protein